MSRIALLPTLLLLACDDAALPTLEEADPDALAIHGGFVPNRQHHRAAVAITTTADPAGGLFCSGTLISAEVVLTAAHCLDETGAVQLFDPADLKVMLGPSPTAPNARFLAVSEVAVDPTYDPSTLAGDIGLLRLAVPVPGFVPRATLISSADGLTNADAGLAMDLVGYGEDDAGLAFGTRLVHRGAVGSVSGDLVIYDQTAGGGCDGDSGGPLFILRSGAVGVAAVMQGSSGCSGAGSLGFATLADTHEAFILSF